MSTKQNKKEQLTTFFIGSDLFGIEVMKVQEVFRNPAIVPVPLAPGFVRGLINLRGQIATALGLRELFAAPAIEQTEQMSVICKIDGNLVSVIVDSIGDVVEVDGNLFEPTPDTISLNIRKYLKGIYKMDGVLLSVIDLGQISKELTPATETLN